MLHAVGMFIFGGSATLGVEQAGFHVDEVLEMTDDMLEHNAYHFHKNRPDIPIVLPKVWDKTGYLAKLRAKQPDLLYANCPCSSLSQLNRNAGVEGKHNDQFYRVFEGIKEVQPKAFIIENAPTLIKLGYPILLDMVQQLGADYRFTVIRDEAGNHNVAMRRQRTLLVGWQRGHWPDGIPLVHMNTQAPTSQRDVLGDLYNAPLGSVPNHTCVPGREWEGYENLFCYIKPGETLLNALVREWPTLDSQLGPDFTFRRRVERAKQKWANGGRVWNKDPERKPEDEVAPSVTSVANFVHPVHDRSFTVREYARLMGYPDDFIFYPDECKTPVIQCIAQGVPARFIEYIAGEVGAALTGQRPLLPNSALKTMCFQYHTPHKKAILLDTQEMQQLQRLEHNPKDPRFFKLTR